MSFAKKHHYIPQFYLKGFTASEGEYYIFDKEKEEIRKSKPTNSFYEKYRNTSRIKGDKTNILEDIYAHLDESYSVQLKRLRSYELGNSATIPPEVLQRVKMFIANIYWRVPESDERIEKEIDRLSFEDAGFKIINSKTGEVVSNEVVAELKSIEAFRKMYRIFLPLLTGNNEFKTIDPQNWRLYHRGNSNQLTSDNPLIIEKYENFGSLNKECLFPISSRKVLVHTKRSKPTSLPSQFLLHLDMLILNQASRFVCCSNEKYLNHLVENLYSFSKNYDFQEEMTKKVFSFFQ